MSAEEKKQLLHLIEKLSNRVDSLEKELLNQRTFIRGFINKEKEEYSIFSKQLEKENQFEKH